MSDADQTSGDALDVTGTPEEVAVDESKSAPDDRETAGPFDITEVPAMRPYVDLGGIKVAPREGQQLRLDVEEATKRILAVSLDFLGSTLQVQAFSSPRSTGLWHHFRTQIAQQLRTQGAQVIERDGALGAELLAELPIPAERGGGTHPVRFIGVDGPRWTLRGVITGAANQDEQTARQIEELYRSLVVVRGEQPMPPMELLALRVPAGAERA